MRMLGSNLGRDIGYRGFFSPTSKIRMRCHNLEDHCANLSKCLSRKTGIQYLTEAIIFLFPTKASSATNPALYPIGYQREVTRPERESDRLPECCHFLGYNAVCEQHLQGRKSAEQQTNTALATFVTTAVRTSNPDHLSLKCQG
jgi:hypothetical protein